ncbi:hypothetical protein [Alkaliphilus transvaalensis]|uniref:hypothetical protein n=1 Tax=Alkaliphilus transvaalensis TaxID=114628 RepID=UPI000479B782|nr:hypothetical protein [Alkaliphilus transvaalensis]
MDYILLKEIFKRNLLTLLLYLLSSFTVGTLLLSLNFYEYASGPMVFIYGLLFIILFIYLGFQLPQITNSILINLSSVMAITILGFLIWLYCYLAHGMITSFTLLSWLSYILYSLWSIPIFNYLLMETSLSMSTLSFLSLLSPLIASLSFFTGHMLKSRRIS